MIFATSKGAKSFALRSADYLFEDILRAVYVVYFDN